MNNTDNRDKLDTVHEAGIDEAAVSDGAAVQGFGFSDTEIKGAIEALLFVTDEPVNILTLADAIQIDPRKAEGSCRRMAFGHSSGLSRTYRTLCYFVGYAKAQPSCLGNFGHCCLLPACYPQ